MRELRAAQVEEDLKNAPTFRPSINHNFRVKQEGDVTQRTIAWDANRRKKQADRRKASDQHKESLVRNTPAINDNSAKIAQMHAMRGRRGRDVSDHLYAHAEQQRLSDRGGRRREQSFLIQIHFISNHRVLRADHAVRDLSLVGSDHPQFFVVSFVTGCSHNYSIAAVTLLVDQQ